MSDTQLVKLTIAQNIFEAHMICAVLADHGIPAHVPGENSMDEWGAVMRSMAARVEVPRGSLEEATRILEEKRAEIAAGKHQLDDESELPQG